MKARWGVLALVGAVVVGFGSGAFGESASPEGFAGGPGVPRVKTTSDFPELPLDRYEFSRRDDKRMEEAAARRTQQCMRSYGFADFPLHPARRTAQSLGGSTFSMTVSTVSPYGMLDLAHVRRWGYGFDPDRVTSWREEAFPEGRALKEGEHEVLYGPLRGDAVEVKGREVPKGGCSGRGQREVMGDPVKTMRVRGYVGERTRELDKAVAKDARVLRAFRDWSRCVQGRGLGRYESPVQAFHDKAWREGVQGGNTARTKRELDTAVADVECNRKLNTAGVWWAVSNEKQRADLRRHASGYAAVRADQERVRAAADEVLGEE
ncbi:hypothetical protein [Streptomyces sp. NPDC052114]|uniref:hypothetical protein n=1 Tax=unclassified Streptomyces TaxID=2593676 RepID=UPI00342D44D2